MKTPVIALALTAMIATPTAFAGETFPIEFQYDRTELKSEEGANAVYKRLRAQIEDACEFTNGRRGISAMNIEKKCIEEAVDTTVKQIKSKSLQAVHQQNVDSQVG